MVFVLFGRRAAKCLEPGAARNTEWTTGGEKCMVTFWCAVCFLVVLAPDGARTKLVVKSGPAGARFGEISPGSAPAGTRKYLEGPAAGRRGHQNSQEKRPQEGHRQLRAGAVLPCFGLTWRPAGGIWR